MKPPSHSLQPRKRGLPDAVGVLPGAHPLIETMLLGHRVGMRSVRRASSAVDELTKLMPDTAERITDDGETEEAPVSELSEGDLVLVRPGASVPADGIVEEGDSDVEEPKKASHRA